MSEKKNYMEMIGLKKTGLDLLIQKGYTITELKKESEFVYLKVSEKQLNKLLEFPFIQFIEPISPPSYPENNTAVTLNRSNYLNSPSDNGLKYDGTGVNVMMQDDGIIGEHIDYQGRLDQSHITSNSGDHGDQHGSWSISRNWSYSQRFSCYG